MKNLENNLPFVSVITPCRNEEEYIEKCLNSIINNNYPKNKIEILIIDGMSTDKTRSIAGDFSQKYPYIKLLDNPQKTTPIAFNLGIKNSKGDLIMIMTSHTVYSSDYVSKCVRYSQKYDADNVGGILITLPREDSLVSRAVAIALSHPFGIGKAPFKTGSKKKKWVDVVFGGCYKKNVFKKIGLFNEKLFRGQDMEFALRLKRAGGKTLLVPEIIAYYYPRSDFKTFCRHNFKNGIWAIYSFKFSKIMPVSLRHLVPFIFVSALIILAILSISSLVFLWTLLVLALVYFLTNIYFSVKIVLKKKKVIYLFILPIIFAALHINYGLGSIWGLIKLLLTKNTKYE